MLSQSDKARQILWYFTYMCNLRKKWTKHIKINTVIETEQRSLSEEGKVGRGNKWGRLKGANFQLQDK